MVNPILLIAVPLAAVFLIGLTEKAGRTLSLMLFFGVLLFSLYVSGSHLFAIFFRGIEAGEIFTAGFRPPLSISLRMGPLESFVVFAAGLIALGAASTSLRRLREAHASALILFLTIMLGATGIIMTRDLFNLFVFMEISSIATAGAAVFTRSRRSLEAGFKYLIAGGIASTLFLIGTIYLYRISGSLYLSDIAAAQPWLSAAGFTAAFLVAAAILIELKPYPANGWALDYYQGVDPLIVSVVATVNSAAMMLALWKVLPLAGPAVIGAVMVTGTITFFFSNLAALRQKDKRRLLGYSSAAQTGLLLTAIAMTAAGMFNARGALVVLAGFFLNHLIAKAALFWHTGKAESGEGRLPGRSAALVFGISLLALAGLPPFPGFWAKWSMITRLLPDLFPGAGLIAGAILLGSLFEAAYLLRWFGSVLSGLREDGARMLPTAAGTGAAFLLTAFGLGGGLILGMPAMVLYWSAGAAVILMLTARMPSRLGGLLTLALVAGFGWWSFPLTSGLARFFWIIFIPGGSLVLFSGLALKGKNWFWPAAGMTVIALGLLTIAASPLEFFFAWEIMTLASYLLIIRGGDVRKSASAAYRYILFSLGGAFAMLGGLALSGAGTAGSLSELSPPGALAMLLILTGFMVKMGSALLHVWLPDAYGEAEDEATALLSAILSKAGVFGLFAAGTMLAGSAMPLFAGLPGLDVPFILRWVGAATALFGALLAVFQEDVKRLLAYSSMSQLGYVLLAFGTMSSLGWTAGLYITFMHALFKIMLFLAAAGVILRTGTRNMYEMGGLIKKMPLTFLSALMAIIAASGVPPLAGFGSKWLLYTSLIESGHYFVAAVAFFASAIAFLYLFRFIHAVFLGQLKTEYREVREAPLPIILPQLLLFIPLMAVSTFPKFLVDTASAIAGSFFPVNFRWEGFSLISSLGYWNATAIMAVTAGAFALPLIWLIIIQRKPRKVGQFNIVFAAERPYRPETTHAAYNFYMPYRLALGFLVKPGAERFWNGITEAANALAGAFRRIYSGNARSYALTIVLYVTVLYLFTWRIF
jgi:formate hydrogenlyase subunit 3/multisubunit Na+/H+ antiporter MnhD subunit